MPRESGTRLDFYVPIVTTSLSRHSHCGGQATALVWTPEHGDVLPSADRERTCRLALNIPSYLEEGAVRAKPPRLAPLTREEFVSKKLAPKLSQQLKVCQALSCVFALAALILSLVLLACNSQHL